MQTKSSLSPKQIVDSSFTVTAQLLSSFKNEVRRSGCFSFSSKGVSMRIDFLIENFNKEQKDFLELCSQIDDLPAKRLAFKGTEGLLVGWKSEIDGSGWWNSTLLEKIYEISRRLISEQSRFEKLFE